MAQPSPRVQFTIPGGAPGDHDEDINMISVDNDTKAPILTILNAPTTNNGANPNVAVGLMGHAKGHVDFKRNSVNVGANHVPYDDGSVRTTHVKNECAARATGGSAYTCRIDRGVMRIQGMTRPLTSINQCEVRDRRRKRANEK